MSLLVLAIGAVHAVFPVIGALISNSKVGVIVGAIVGFVIALASGNPAFIAADLLGIGLGTWIGFLITTKKPGNSNEVKHEYDRRNSNKKGSEVLEGVAKFFDETNDVIKGYRQGLEKSLEKKRAMSDFKFAIHKESNSLKNLAKMAETKQQFELVISRRPPKYRKLYEEKLAELSEGLDDDSPTMAEVFTWEKIIKPCPVENDEIQREIESECEDLMKERSKQIAELKERCAKDLLFRRFFCEKLIETNCPAEYAIEIVSEPFYFESLKSHEMPG